MSYVVDAVGIAEVVRKKVNEIDTSEIIREHEDVAGDGKTV